MRPCDKSRREKRACRHVAFVRPVAFLHGRIHEGAHNAPPVKIASVVPIDKYAPTANDSERSPAVRRR